MAGKGRSGEERQHRDVEPFLKLPIHILVGEDDEVNRIFVQQLLKYMDANVTLAVNGEDVIHHCTGQKYGRHPHGREHADHGRD